MKRSTERRIEYRWFIAGAEVDPEAFWAELRRLGGRAVVEEVDLSGPRPTAKGEAEARLVARRREEAPDA
jgi:hypothetical protein